MNVFLVVLAAGIASYLLRVSMLLLASRFGVPVVLESTARFAVPVAFAALATTALVPRLAISGHSVAVAGAIAVAVIAVRRTGSSSAALLAGMPTLWILSAALAVR
jgi:branched-subunit amino acid transport protein